MQIQDNNSKYGLVSKLLHWIIFILFTTQYFLVYRRDFIPKGLPLRLEYILLHKSIGITLLFIGILFIIWRKIINNNKISCLSSLKFHEKILAKITHFCLYLAIFFMPLTGTLMSLFGKKDLFWFGIKIPKIFGIHKYWASFCYVLHVNLQYMILFLVGLHVIGALKHLIIDRDQTLKRML